MQFEFINLIAATLQVHSNFLLTEFFLVNVFIYEFTYLYDVVLRNGADSH